MISLMKAKERKFYNQCLQWRFNQAQEVKDNTCRNILKSEYIKASGIDLDNDDSFDAKRTQSEAMHCSLDMSAIVK